jgi:L-ascorbate metabolism protein UlaG (beta-lactamase superfamily)
MKKTLLLISLATVFFSVACEKEESVDPIKIDSVVQNVSIYGESDGSIVLTVKGGKEPYNFNWSNGATTKDIINVPVGAYSVIVTGANGDTASHSVNVTEPVKLKVQFTKTNTNAIGATTGGIELTISGGVQPYAILCNSQTVESSITGLAAGNYAVKVTDANQSQVELNVTIADPLTLTLIATNASSYNGSDGAVSLSITGGIAPYTFLWSNNQTLEDISGIPAGYYTVTVTDADSVVKQKSVTVYEVYDRTSEAADVLSGIERLLNSGIRIVYNSKIIYIDPINTGGYSADADLILVTHSHGDHFSTGTITTLAKPGTLFVGPSECQTGMTAIGGAGNYSLVAPGDSVNLAGFPINVVYAYNNNHFTPTSVGYILIVNGIRVYHAGDTKRIPEMTDYNADIAFLPLGPTYTMASVASAADAARDTGAEIVVPIHYGSGASEGKDKDAWDFKSLLDGEIDVVVKPSKR